MAMEHKNEGQVVYARAWIRNEDYFIWYRLDMAEKSIMKEADSIELNLPSGSADRLIFPKAVASGSVIFLLGACEKGEKRSEGDADSEELYDAYFFNAHEYPRVCTKIPSFCLCRSHPMAAAVSGKVIVFDSCGVYEICDSNPTSFRKLSLPPDMDALSVSGPVLSDSSNGRLIIYRQDVNALYAYYVDSEVWECIVENFYLEDIAQVVGDVLYWHCDFDCHIHAYDIVNNKPLKTLSFPLCSHWESIFDAGNGKMGLITSETPPGGCGPNNDKLIILCFIFTIQRNESEVRATEMTDFSFIINCSAFPEFVAIHKRSQS